MTRGYRDCNVKCTVTGADEMPTASAASNVTKCEPSADPSVGRFWLNEKLPAPSTATVWAGPPLTDTVSWTGPVLSVTVPWMIGPDRIPHANGGLVTASVGAGCAWRKKLIWAGAD